MRPIRARRKGCLPRPDSIYTELDQHQMAFIYKSPSGNPDAGKRESNNPEQFAATPSPAMPDQMPGTANAAVFNSPASSAAEASARLSSSEQAAMDELHRRLKEGSEVICVIRPRGKPDAQSEVIMLDRASPEFVKQIASEGRKPDKPYQTSLELPKPAQNLARMDRPAGTTGSNAALGQLANGRAAGSFADLNLHPPRRDAA